MTERPAHRGSLRPAGSRAAKGRWPARFGEGALIFISVASYRDPELGPTLEDCIAKARHPDRLRFAVCWQHGLEESPPPRLSDPRVHVIDVPWRASRGACWARAELMKLWQGEDWFFQIDSHHRFARDWDVVLLDQAARSGSAQPVVTTYCPPYTPGQADPASQNPTRIEFDRFSDDGIPMFRPVYFDGWQERAAPYRSRFASAHFFLAPGQFAREVQYDPDLYFTGEEIMLAVRAFTHGYDLFEPSRLIMWHEFTRGYRAKHWEDHVEENRVRVAWHKRDSASRMKIQRFFRRPWVGRFGCGTERTLADYEAYAGISLSHRRVQDYTRRTLEPPNPPAEKGWEKGLSERRVHIVLDTTALPSEAVETPAFWYVGFHSRDGAELYRKDADRDELADLLAGRPQTVIITREFDSFEDPASWTVMPYITDRGWQNPVRGRLDPGYVGSLDAEFRKSETNGHAADPGRAFPCMCPGLTWSQVDESNFEVRAPVDPNRSHALNGTAMLLLQLADGESSVSEITESLRELYPLRERWGDEVRDFYRQATETGLIEVGSVGGRNGKG